jgi:hypothetical protein
MKLPKTFVPEPERSKKKIYELSKKHGKHNPKLEDIDENTTLEDKIITQAKEVAKRLGGVKGESYVFTDKKNNLMISYNPAVAFQDVQLLTIQYKKSWSKKEYLFKSIKWNDYSKEEIRVYVPGDWQVHLDKLYKTAQQK